MVKERIGSKLSIREKEVVVYLMGNIQTLHVVFRDMNSLTQVIAMSFAICDDLFFGSGSSILCDTRDNRVDFANFAHLIISHNWHSLGPHITSFWPA